MRWVTASTRDSSVSSAMPVPPPSSTPLTTACGVAAFHRDVHHALQKHLSVPRADSASPAPRVLQFGAFGGSDGHDPVVLALELVLDSGFRAIDGVREHVQ